ncbi:SET domain-containing protein [Cucurbitaria berberidis CBS 394.84]|uniref:SET domain-containing protein n=1 Tax=Cucurbitaria berberidis CBS 394.84 TaxID=1168544 RepID=A0A9P4L8R1_9PLEO|nr:SET domain-containing protein [Cucurbitaria berberidis CBS 394.84]KAF1845543.1 SET domain-containing protein [Cucurbitaria berberidis CBS 394.84]
MAEAMCALCSQSGLDSDLKRCARCLTTYYCSRECQRQHWKAHKAECITNAQRIYEVRSIPGKGQGMIAKCKIPRGTRIISEKPIFIVPRGVNDMDALENAILKDVARLSAEQRKAFFALHNIHGEKHDPALGIARTNALPLGAGALESGVFLQASRINHACSSNAQNTWNTNTKQLTIHACKDINAGEEICISYLDSSENYASRQRDLKAGFGFDCTCKLCVLPPPQRQQSDARLDEITKLDDIVGDGMSIIARPMTCLHHVHTIIQLLKEEHFTDARVARAYYDALQIAIANGDQARAKVFADRACAERVVLEGEDSPEAKRLKGFGENPSTHMLYGTKMGWKQDVKKVPRNMSATDFESWLWRKKL